MKIEKKERIVNMKTVAIIAAGGSSERLPGECKKQFRLIAGRPVLAHTIDRFYLHPSIDSLLVTVPKEDLETAINLLQPDYSDADITIFEGGLTRQQSVFGALNVIPDDTDFVIIHDGVRPLTSSDDLNNLLQLCYEKNAVIPVHRVKNTIKRINEDKVVETITRDNLVEVYTPQVFRFQLIKEYHQKAASLGLTFTDDAAILEHYGVPVYVYETEKADIKITEQNDFDILKLLIETENTD